MSIMGNDEPKAPFFIPFLVALLFGSPVTGLWYAMATKAGLVVAGITILTGLACGLGARIAAPGEHAGGAAVIATLILIVVNISMITVLVMASEGNHSFLVQAMDIVKHGNFADFANECVRVAGKTFIRYPIALYAAYRVADAT